MTFNAFIAAVSAIAKHSVHIPQGETSEFALVDKRVDLKELCRYILLFQV